MPGLVRTISNTFGITEDSERDFEGLSTIARRKRIILPTSTFRGFWDWFIIVLVLYNAVSIPLEIGFETSTPLAQQVVDVFVDVFFIEDRSWYRRVFSVSGRKRSPCVHPNRPCGSA